MTKLMAVLITAFCLVAVSTSAQAKHRHHHHRSTVILHNVTVHVERISHRGACDGIHRCRCGSTQANYFGLPRIYNGHNLWRAAEWKDAFPHTTPHIGAVGYQHGGGPSGHVFRIVSYSGGCTATVSDDAGQYERNICSRGAVFMDANGNGVEPNEKRHKRMATLVMRDNNWR